MEWLNYHHLFYFSVIVEEGGVAAAARKLRLSHSTLSAQLRALEGHFGAPLFERKGKRLIPTALGLEAVSYATDIFRLGRELNDVARGRANPGRELLRVGVVAGIPKTLVHYLLSPALDELHAGSTSVRQDTPQNLAESLAAGRLQLVLTNDVPTIGHGLRVHAHPLGETDILLYGRSDLARTARKGFPRSLGGMPMVLPPTSSPLRKRLDAWFIARDIEVTVRAEVEDAGVLRAFGSAGRGVFPVRAALESEIEDLRDVQLIGPCEGVREGYYAVTTERRVRQGAIAAIIARARAELLVPTRRIAPTRRK